MKKLIFFLFLLFLTMGCSYKKHPTENAQEDSLATVYGFAKLPIDSGIKMPYKEFIAYKDSFMPIYDEITHNIVFMRSKCSCKYGDWYVDVSGDTMFCVEDGYAKYVSAEEWHEYYEKYKEQR